MATYLDTSAARPLFISGEYWQVEGTVCIVSMPQAAAVKRLYLALKSALNRSDARSTAEIVTKLIGALRLRTDPQWVDVWVAFNDPRVALAILKAVVPSDGIHVCRQKADGTWVEVRLR